jgi:hypothetical protein
MQELNVIIPKEQLNDFAFIYNKLLEVKMDVLQIISNKTNKMMKDLVLEFIPELKDADNNTIILTKYNLPLDLFSRVETPLVISAPVPIIANKKIVIKKKTDVVKVEPVSVSSATIVPEVELEPVSVSSVTIVPEVLEPVSVSSVAIVPEVVKVELEPVSVSSVTIVPEVLEPVSVSSVAIVPEVIKKKIVIKKK